MHVINVLHRFRGEITAYDAQTGLHMVRYDDGDERRYNFKTTPYKHRLLPIDDACVSSSSSSSSSSSTTACVAMSRQASPASASTTPTCSAATVTNVASDAVSCAMEEAAALVRNAMLAEAANFSLGLTVS